MRESCYICVDFDGTCVTHDYPGVGKDIGAQAVLRALLASDHELILFTMRSGDGLQAAVEWFRDNGISLYGVNVNPTQKHWTSSPKAYGHLYIDDAALGCPLALDPKLSERPFVDWKGVEEQLITRGYLPKPKHKTYAKRRNRNL